MTKFALFIALSIASLTSRAGLLSSPVIQGKKAGASLLEVVSEQVPPRAARDAFAFFNSNDGLQRDASVYAIGPDRTKPALSNFVCEPGNYVCRIDSVRQHLFSNKRFMVIFDLTQSSMKPRLHIVNLKTGEVTSLYASHGKESSCPGDPSRACQFISDRDSEASPLGFFLTGHTYYGVVGWTIPLVGLQGSAPGIERNDVPTTIVIHGSAYASADFRRAHGYMGRSLGCPALSFDDIKTWKDRLQDGALFYFYHSSLPIGPPAPVSNVVETLRFPTGP